MVRRASDLLSPWVGVAEQQIAAMFREAERNEQILLLDEADSLLRDRRQAVRSWELTQTNELLTQIENFNGIFLACTNLLATLDQAVLRRFAWKVRFLPATPAQCVSLFRRWFPALPADAATRQRLQAIAGLSPGDFKAVERRCRFGGPPLLDEVLQALAEECRLRQDPSGRQPRIGFQ
jgi:SpoVK/Ycf46/Vps4 family AAA+-type ATPase